MVKVCGKTEKATKESMDEIPPENPETESA